MNDPLARCYTAQITMDTLRAAALKQINGKALGTSAGNLMLDLSLLSYHQPSDLPFPATIIRQVTT